MIGWWLLLQAVTPTPAAPPTPAPVPPAPVPLAPRVTGVGVKAGESVIIRVAADGTVAVVDGHPGNRRPLDGEARLDLRVAGGKTTLVVTNAAPRFLLYRAAIQREGGARPERTSICPVLPGGKPGIETWPYAIGQAVLYGWRYEDHPAMACR